MNVVVDGLMVNYQKTGSGKTLIMLHGWGDSLRTFLPLIAELKDEYEVYTLDLPGFGGTQFPAKPWGLEDYACFVQSWIKKIGINERYFLLGHSFGGSVAIVGTADQKLHPDKLILLASAGIRDKRNVQKRVLRAAAKAGRVPLNLLPSRHAQRIKIKLYKRIGSDVLLVPTLRETFRKVVSQDLRSLANKVSRPTLLIYGSSDQETPVSDARILHESIAGSKLEIVESGHMLHQSDPEKVAGIIRNFLRAK